MPDINQIKNNKTELKNSINLLNKIIKEITDELLGNLEVLYKINNMINLFEIHKRNYQILKNANEINFYNKFIIEKISDISKNNNLLDIIQIIIRWDKKKI